MTSKLPPFTPKEVKYTTSPNPDWKIGQGITATAEGQKWMEGEKSGWKTLDVETDDPRYLYGLLLSGIVPRPVAFCSTISETGVENLAPFSWFNQVSAFPPTISISCGRGEEMRFKDTVLNITATKGFTVNIISEPWVEQANICSTDAPADVGEWRMSGLTKEPSVYVKPSRVKESAFSMECELMQTVEVKYPQSTETTATLILAAVKYVHVRKDMLDERGMINPAKLRPVARMGGILYARVTDGFQIQRLPWEELEDEVNKLPNGKTPNGKATNGKATNGKATNGTAQNGKA